MRLPQQPFIYGPLPPNPPRAAFSAIISNSAHQKYNKKERGGRRFTFALVPLPHSIPSQSVAKIINHGDRACLLFGKMGSEGRSARRSSGEEKKCPSYGKVVGCGRLAAVSGDRVSFCE